MARIKIYGPPGCGKTTSLINIVEQELAAGVAPSEIIYTSFTRAAAAEARSRAQRKFTQYDKKAFHYFSTIHSICHRELGIKKDQMFTDKKLDEFSKVFKYQLSGLDPTREGLPDSPYKEGVLQTECDYAEFFCHWHLHRMLPLQDAFKIFMQEHQEVPPAFNQRYLLNYMERRLAFKNQYNLVDYTDLLVKALELGLCPDGIRVVVRDEEQDSSPLLSKVADLWSRKAERVYLAGDPEQAIYDWSGAVPRLFMDWDADETVVLQEGHRCSRAVTMQARVVQSRMRNRYAGDQFTPTSVPGESRHVGYVNWMELIAENKDIFFLHRTRWLVSKSYSELMDNGIPFHVLRGKEPPLQKKIGEVFRALYLLLEDQQITIQQLCDIADKVSATPWMERGAKTQIKEREEERPQDQVYITDMPGLGFRPDFMLHLKRADFRPILKGEPDEITYLERLYQHHGIKVFQSTPRLKVGTYHSVKGMEADIVVLNPEFTTMVKRAYALNPEPEHRLMYVGVTRAKEKVIRLMPNNGGGYTI